MLFQIRLNTLEHKVQLHNHCYPLVLGEIESLIIHYQGRLPWVKGHLVFRPMYSIRIGHQFGKLW